MHLPMTEVLAVQTQEAMTPSPMTSLTLMLLTLKQRKILRMLRMLKTSVTMKKSRPRKS
jgi:hypothetical protein